MRSRARMGGWLGIAAAAGLLHAAGCYDLSSDCNLFDCRGGAAGGGGSGGGGNPACEADPTADPEAVIDACGVFVSASAAAGGDGTKGKPFQSFGEAAATTPKRVFACAEAYAESVGVSFGGGVEIYAGFTGCNGDAGWTWSAGAKGTLKGPADSVALTLRDGASRLENLDVIAEHAAADGGSSIAVVASGGTLEVVNGNLTAGDARDGAAGEEYAIDPLLNGEAGDPGVGVCAAMGASNNGPMGKTKTCETGGASVGGNGGDGGKIEMSMAAIAGSGGDGTPADPNQPAKGVGGVGEGQGAATECDIGLPGASGVAGNSGAGATGVGNLSATGYAGIDGIAGTNGKPGQGGGGGGGAKGDLNINCGMGLADRVGASGGAGGTGGCGGHGGGAGKAGGSSIALVVVDAAVTLTGVTLTAGRGGSGGKGGDGQTGGLKGVGGDAGAGTGAAKSSCRGGDGGAGGLGAPGGGGLGGHSLGIAFQGSTAPVGGEFVLDPQQLGVGGPGGLNNSTAGAGKGADGVAGNCWDFTANASCGG